MPTGRPLYFVRTACGTRFVPAVRKEKGLCLSSSYSGLFQKTGLPGSLKKGIHAIACRTSPYAALLCTSALAGIVACNQTLTIMLTRQLCGEIESDNTQFALHLEDSAVVVAPLIPWSIACGVPLASIGAPSSCILSACFLYLLPLWRLGVEAAKRGRKFFSEHPE